MENEEFNSPEENISRVRITRRVNMGFRKGFATIFIALVLAKLILPESYLSFPDIFTLGGCLSLFCMIMLIWGLNLFLRPLMILFTLPFVLLTLGAGVIFLEALIIWLASVMVPGSGIVIKSFWTALLLAFFIEFITWIFTVFEARKVFKEKEKREKNNKDDDTIDV